MASVTATQPFETSEFTLEFSTTYEMLLQQRTGRFRSLVSSKTYRGKAAAAVNQIGALQYKMPAGRYSPLQFQIAQFTRPWVQPTDRSLAVPFDTFDALKAVTDPKAAIAMSVVAAADRFYDDIIIAAFLGSTYRGEDNSNWTAETFPSTASTTTSSSAPFGGFLIADTFGSGASVGMTFNKVRELRRVAKHYENNLEEETVNVAIGSQQDSDLFGQIEVIDKRFNAQSVIENGNVTGFMGCRFVPSERLQTSSSNSLRNCPAWVPSGMHLGIWMDMNTRVDNRIDLEGHPWQLYSMISAGAIRTQLGKVFQVNCADTTGSDITP
jgi:hypothetical protein